MPKIYMKWAEMGSKKEKFSDIQRLKFIPFVQQVLDDDI